MLLRRFSSVQKGNLYEAAASSIIYLTRFHQSTLDFSLTKFRQHLLPAESRASLPKAFDNIPIEKSKTDRIEFYSRLSHLEPQIRAASAAPLNSENLLSALKVITEFWDKGQVGFLTGDLSPELVNLLADHVGFIDTQDYDSNVEIYEKLEEFLSKENFSLPKYGIVHPEHENPQAMFLRELLVEKDAAEVTLENLRKDTDTLTHNRFGMNVITPKK